MWPEGQELSRGVEEHREMPLGDGTRPSKAPWASPRTLAFTLGGRGGHCGAEQKSDTAIQTAGQRLGVS